MSLQGHRLTLKLNLMGGSQATLMWTRQGVSRLQNLVQQDGRCGAHVERFDASAQRQRDQLVARRGHARPQAPALRPEHQHDAAAPVDRGRRSRPPPPRRSIQQPAAFALAEEVGEIAHARDRECSTAPADALQTAGVTSAERRSGSITPVAPAHSAVAADRAEVLRVRDLVERDEERLGPASSAAASA